MNIKYLANSQSSNVIYRGEFEAFSLRHFPRPLKQVHCFSDIQIVKNTEYCYYRLINYYYKEETVSGVPDTG